MKHLLLKEFQKRFKREADYLFFCPGRVNLIGEHIDYNGGYVMPCAISLGTWLAVSKNTEKILKFQSMDFPETADLHLQDSYSKTGKEWYNYPLGVINELAALGHYASGLDMLYAGNLPVSSGLSSSASIEVLTAFALTDMFGLDISKKDMALLCKKAENEFIGVSCGIMDQFAVAMGKENHAILLHCDTLTYEYLPLQPKDHVLVIINTNKPRKLVESKYNERFLECGKALTALKKVVPVQNLCDLAPDTLLLHRQDIGDPVLEKRALHVVLENDRVKKAAEALRKEDMTAFGKLMYASHQSLQELYEVSGKELDTIVAFCQGYEGCIGARMTGAGFGGCAIAFIERKCVDDFAEKMKTHYTDQVGYPPDVFATMIEDGVRKLEI
ncbi:MAG TPA: galactokinase [Chitinophagaceae bacterium]|nr:galactokinase [Chitinophagaceae bacterium]